MYPTLVVMLVAAQGSLVERSTCHTLESGPVQFAVPIVTTTVDGQTTRNSRAGASLGGSFDPEREAEFIKDAPKEHVIEMEMRESAV